MLLARLLTKYVSPVLIFVFAFYFRPLCLWSYQLEVTCYLHFKHVKLIWLNRYSPQNSGLHFLNTNFLSILSKQCFYCKKKLEIEKTQPTIVISVLKVDVTTMGLILLILHKNQYSWCQACNSIIVNVLLFNAMYLLLLLKLLNT